MEDQAATPNPAALKFERHEDFAELYANHTWFDLTVWDLKITFGELDQFKGTNVVSQHTAMTVSWLQAKVMAYLLEVNLLIYERNNGVIRTPVDVIPPAPSSSVNPEWEKLGITDQLRQIHARC